MKIRGTEFLATIRQLETMRLWRRLGYPVKLENQHKEMEDYVELADHGKIPWGTRRLQKTERPWKIGRPSRWAGGPLGTERP